MQMSFFGGQAEKKITKPIRLIELFAGIGSQAKALSRLGVPFQHYRICEFDKYAVQSYNAIHGTDFKPSDITKIHAEDLAVVDTDKYEYILTYSFPCQDLSLAGNQKGMEKGSGTRSGLLWEVERLLDEMVERPQILLMENVPQVIAEKNVKDFAKWVEKLESLGYKCYWELLNAKDYGVPQNRNRCFMVSILGNYFYSFPKGFHLNERLKDRLEKNVDEKYYLSEDTVKSLELHKLRHEEKGHGLRCEMAGTLNGGGYEKMYEQSRRVYGENGLRPTLHCCDGGNLEPKILEPHLIGGFGEKKSNGGTQWYQQDRVYDSNGIAMAHPAQIPEGSYKYQVDGIRIRKLTPKECWRLMDFDDADIDKAKASGVSDSQLYKQAGNSIVVAVLENIFKQML